MSTTSSWTSIAPVSVIYSIYRNRNRRIQKPIEALPISVRNMFLPIPAAIGAIVLACPTTVFVQHLQFNSYCMSMCLASLVCRPPRRGPLLLQARSCDVRVCVAQEFVAPLNLVGLRSSPWIECPCGALCPVGDCIT